MTINATKLFENLKAETDTVDYSFAANFPLIEKFNIDVYNLPVDSKYNLKLNFSEKIKITEKLLEAHILAKANVEAGNITGRGFASNIYSLNGKWTLGTNFNNTRNDISSVCGERTAILAAYNDALMEYCKNPEGEFGFKVKYILMAQSVELSDTGDAAIPCEDCLSWFNTSRFFDDDTIIFAFENKEGILSLKAITLKELLPYRNLFTSSKYDENKKIEYSYFASKAAEKSGIDETIIQKLINKSFEKYNKISLGVSGQKTVCSILANEKIYTKTKTDWTKRWFAEPLEIASIEAIEENENTKITAVCYFGDEFAGDNFEFNDGLISIKSLGRIRQKYADSNTLLILNLKDSVFVTTIGEYLPKKFIQGYKI